MLRLFLSDESNVYIIRTYGVRIHTVELWMEPFHNATLRPFTTAQNLQVSCTFQHRVCSVCWLAYANPSIVETQNSSFCATLLYFMFCSWVVGVVWLVRYGSAKDQVSRCFYLPALKLRNHGSTFGRGKLAPTSGDLGTKDWMNDTIAYRWSAQYADGTISHSSINHDLMVISSLYHRGGNIRSFNTDNIVPNVRGEETGKMKLSWTLVSSM